MVSSTGLSSYPLPTGKEKSEPSDTMGAPFCAFFLAKCGFAHCLRACGALSLRSRAEPALDLAYKWRK